MSWQWLSIYKPHDEGKQMVTISNRDTDAHNSGAEVAANKQSDKLCGINNSGLEQQLC